MIKWLVAKLLPYLSLEMQRDEGMINVHKRLQRLEKDSHPPLFDKSQLNKIHKRLEDLETKTFVEQFKGMKNYEGTD